jgi:hypothetical protein
MAYIYAATKAIAAPSNVITRIFAKPMLGDFDGGRSAIYTERVTDAIANTLAVRKTPKANFLC